MTHYQRAKLVEAEGHEFDHGIVLTDLVILRFLKSLNEQTKYWLLSRYMDTRTDRYLILFPNWELGLFRPDDLEVTWHNDEVAS